MTTNNLVIETTSLTKEYGDIVADNDLSLQVQRGQVFGLLGPNGSGKTTTMGMLRDSSGQCLAASSYLVQIRQAFQLKLSAELALSSSHRPSTRICRGAII